MLSSSFDVLPPGSVDPGAVARLGHGDALHVTDIDLNRPGLEVFMVHEHGPLAPYGGALRDAATPRRRDGQGATKGQPETSRRRLR